MLVFRVYQRIFFLNTNNDHIDLNTLIDGCIQGDESSWITFFRIFHPTIKGTATQFRNIEDPEDIAQKVYFKLIEDEHKRLKIFKGDHLISFKNYLKKITKFVCLDEWKKARKDPEYLETHEIESFPHSIELKEAYSIPIDTWQEALMQLQPQPRESIELLKLGFTNQKISEIMGVPIGTVLSWNKRSKEKLKKILEKNKDLQ
jgi:RNA polymerase sigma factor (sigma-70 family)